MASLASVAVVSRLTSAPSATTSGSPRQRSVPPSATSISTDHRAALPFYANCAMAWIVTVATDIIVNKYWLKLSPKQPEFRRGMLYDWNPVGVVSVVLSAGVSIAIFFGAFGPSIQPFSPIFAILIALVATPLMAIATRGRYYLRRSDDGIDAPMLDVDGNPSAEKYLCHVSGIEFERPDMLMSAEPGPNGEKQYISSLALATDKRRQYVLPADPPVV